MEPKNIILLPCAADSYEDLLLDWNDDAEMGDDGLGLAALYAEETSR